MVRTNYIYIFFNSLVEQIRTLDTMIILGETGCGKTTQIPKYILQNNINRNELIVITQVSFILFVIRP